MGMDIISRLKRCGDDVGKWGRTYLKDFQIRIDKNKKRMDEMRGRRDVRGMEDYKRAEQEYMHLLEQQHIFWRQRAKEHWYKGGDQNTKYFHNSVKARKWTNRIHKLLNRDGQFVNDPASISKVMTS